MEPKNYIVTEISGEYATLTERISGETLFIALLFYRPAQTSVLNFTMKCWNIQLKNKEDKCYGIDASCCRLLYCLRAQR